MDNRCLPRGRGKSSYLDTLYVEATCVKWIPRFQNTGNQTTNNYTGNTIVNAGLLRLNKNTNNTTIQGNVTVSGGTFRWDAATQVKDTSAITLNSGSLDVLSGTFTDIIGSLTFNGGTIIDDGQINVVAAGVALTMRGGTDLSNRFALSNSGAQTVRFNSVNNGTAVISNNLTLVGPVSGTVTKTFDIDDGTAAVDMNITATMGEWASGSQATTAGLTKIGDGTLAISGAATYSGVTAVNAGELIVDGSLAGGVNVGSNGLLTGGGTVGAIGGDGMVSPGASPGILTAASIDGSTGTGMDFSFEFTGFGTTPGVENDVLALTDPTSPFSGNPLGAANTVDIYLGVSTLSLNKTFRGGFFTERDVDFLDSIRDADFNVFVKGDGSGTTAFGGENYYTLTEFGAGWNVTLSTEVDSGGYVMQLQVVPEPITMLAVGLGIASLGGYVRKRKR